MTNPIKGEINLRLGKTEYKTRLTIDSIIKIENELDKGILAITQKIADGDVRVSELRGILLHALRGGGNDFSEKDVSAIISEVGIVDACRAVAEILTVSLISPENEPEE